MFRVFGFNALVLGVWSSSVNGLELRRFGLRGFEGSGIAYSKGLWLLRKAVGFNIESNNRIVITINIIDYNYNCSN